MKDRSAIEIAVHISESVKENFSDIADIDFAIEELNRRKKEIAGRLKKNSSLLKNIINDKDIVKQLNKETLEDFCDSLAGVEDLVNSINSSIGV